jgi:hypothetical protein
MNSNVLYNDQQYCIQTAFFGLFRVQLISVLRVDTEDGWIVYLSGGLAVANWELFPLVLSWMTIFSKAPRYTPIGQLQYMAVLLATA